MTISSASLGSGRPRDLSTEEWEARLGDQLRASRIAVSLDQAGLAEAAGVSIGAVRGLERGSGSTLKTLIRVVRVLGREDWLESLSPAVAVSPIDVMRTGRRDRSRVYRSRAETTPRRPPASGAER